MLRFAQSLTSDMNIANLRIALFNHILSKQLNEDLIIRLEDINKEQNIEDKDKEIIEILNLFSIDYIQVLNQSENAKYHKQMATQIDTDKMSLETYTCAIDDMLSNISTVIYDENTLLDIPLHLEIRSALGYDKEINYIKVPTILNIQNSIDGVSNIKWLIGQGFLPVAIANYIVGLGYDTPCDIFTIEEAIEWFDINKISKEPASFDIEKLKLINSEYLKTIDEMRLSKLLGYADSDLGAYAKLHLQECNTIKELKFKVDMLFSAKETLDGLDEELKSLQECIRQAPYIDDFNDFVKYMTEKTGLKEEQFFKALEFALTGATTGLDLSRVYPLIKNYLGEIV